MVFFEAAGRPLNHAPYQHRLRVAFALIKMLPLYLCIFLLADVMFAATGGLLIAVVLISKRDMVAPTTETVAPNLLLAHAPLNSES